MNIRTRASLHLLLLRRYLVNLPRFYIKLWLHLQCASSKRINHSLKSFKFLRFACFTLLTGSPNSSIRFFTFIYESKRSGTLLMITPSQKLDLMYSKGYSVTLSWNLRNIWSIGVILSWFSLINSMILALSFLDRFLFFLFCYSLQNLSYSNLFLFSVFVSQ